MSVSLRELLILTSENRYLQELRNLAINMKGISSGTVTRMRRAPILLAMQFKPRGTAKGDDMDDEEWDPTYGLKKAESIVIVDDTNTYQAFKDVLWTAPQEDLMECMCLYGNVSSPN